MALKRLDHLIFRVPDIRAVHEALVSTYPEAWPIGPFWPGRLTSGIAIGGLSVELVQSMTSPVEEVFGETLVFEPTSLAEAERVYRSVGIRGYVEEKFERSTELLALRGFQGVAAHVPQLICTNLYLVDLGPLNPYPVEFFVCEYSPVLKEWLAPTHRRLSTPSVVLRVLYGTPDPVLAQNMLLELGYAGEVPIDFTKHPTRQILRVETNLGPIPILA